jgi:hypothetical protein
MRWVYEELGAIYYCKILIIDAWYYLSTYKRDVTHFIEASNNRKRDPSLSIHIPSQKWVLA